jgi:3-oxoacyl-[acyl-carrier protein] reductase
MAELAGKHVLVTGASRGIGAAAAVALAAAGAALTLAARDPERLAEVAGGIAAAGGRAETAVCDVANYSAVSAVVEEARRRLGPIDAVINNAGIVEPIGRVSDGDPAAWARSIGINLIGAYNVIRAVLPGMLAAGAGVIVNLSSGAATTPLEGWSGFGDADPNGDAGGRSCGHPRLRLQPRYDRHRHACVDPSLGHKPDQPNPP